MTPRLRIHQYKVRGRGPFPIDMLRHDQAWPVSPDDSAKISIGIEHDAAYDWRTIFLNGVARPSVARWKSFTWEVIAEGHPDWWNVS